MRFKKATSLLPRPNRAKWDAASEVTGEIKGKEHTKKGNYTECFIEGRSYLTFVPHVIAQRALPTPSPLLLVFHNKHE